MNLNLQVTISSLLYYFHPFVRALQAKLEDLHWQPAYINVSDSLSYGIKFRVVYMLIWREVSNRYIFV